MCRVFIGRIKTTPAQPICAGCLFFKNYLAWCVFRKKLRKTGLTLKFIRSNISVMSPADKEIIDLQKRVIRLTKEGNFFIVVLIQESEP